DGKLADFEATQNISLRIFKCFAMLTRKRLRQFVHVLVEKLDQPHEHARATLRVRRGPTRLRRLGRLNSRIQFGITCKGYRSLNLTCCRIEDVGSASTFTGNPLAVDKMT